MHSIPIEPVVASLTTEHNRPEEGGRVQVGLALVAAQAVLVERPGLRVHPLLLKDLSREMNAIRKILLSNLPM